MRPRIYKIIDEEDAKTLTTECGNVDVESEEMQECAHALHIAMSHSERKLAGLAAPQIGFPIRMLIMRWGADLIMLVNPTIEKTSDKTYTYREGCASCPPDYYLETKRPAAVTVEYYDMLQKRRVRTKFKARDAVVVQHELDHLDGVCIWDAESEDGKTSLKAIADKEAAAKAEKENPLPADIMVYKNGSYPQSDGCIRELTK